MTGLAWIRAVGHWRLRWVPVLLGFCLVLLVVTPQGRAALKGAGLVMQVVPQFPIKPLQWFTPTPQRSEVAFNVEGGQVVTADLYRIAGRTHEPAVLLFLGVTPAGPDDPRVVNLGMALARTGFAVLIPWAPDMVAGSASPSDVTLLASAYEYLRARPFVDPHRVGMGGFSVGASLLTVAAEEPAIRNQIAFLHYFGGYYDARDYLAEYSSHTAFIDNKTYPWAPDPEVGHVFANLLIGNLSKTNDRTLLTERFINGQTLTGDQLQSLSHDGQEVYQLLSGAPLAQAQRLVSELPRNDLQEMAALSPSTNIANLKAPMFIIHDRADNLEPVEESERLAQALQSRGNYTFAEFSFFQHVTPGKHTSVFTLIHDSFKLFEDLYNVTRYAA